MNVLILLEGSAFSWAFKEASDCCHTHDWNLRIIACRKGEALPSSDKADMLVVQPPLMTERLTALGKPILLLERIDGAQLAASRSWLDHANIMGVMKGYTFKSASLNNEIMFRYHTHLLKQAGIYATGKTLAESGKPGEISATMLERIYVAFGFGQYWHLRGFVAKAPNLDAPRLYDTHFAGTVRYQGSEVETHRLLAYRAAHLWSGAKIAYQGCIMPERQFDDSLKEAYTVLSPWGLGEACHRDYQAMLYGAVVIKPRTDHLECWPDIFQPNKTYVPCKLDFSDAHEKIAEVKRNWRDYPPLPEYARQLMFEGRKPENLEKRIVDIFTRSFA